MNLKGRNFLTLKDYTYEEITYLLDLAAELKEKKKTVILVEHKIDLIAEYADEVLVFKDGSLVAAGDKQEILSDMSLLEKGVALPQVAILGNTLKEEGIPLKYIPVTEKQAEEVFSELITGKE